MQELIMTSDDMITYNLVSLLYKIEVVVIVM